MDKLITKLQEKAKACGDKTKEDRARKGAYIDCIVELKALRKHDVSGSLPTLEDATKVAVRISEEAITPPLDVKEQALFIAGFQECIKWLNVVFSNDR